MTDLDPTLVVDLTDTGHADWPWTYEIRNETGIIIGVIDARRVLGNRLDGSYPVGAEDRELRISPDSSPGAIRVAVHAILADSPRCRRVVLAVPVGQLESMRTAEEAGLRFVVDVDTHRESLSLLVAEPDWVLSQPSAIEDLPL